MIKWIGHFHAANLGSFLTDVISTICLSDAMQYEIHIVLKSISLLIPNLDTHPQQLLPLKPKYSLQNFNAYIIIIYLKVHSKIVLPTLCSLFCVDWYHQTLFYLFIDFTTRYQL